MGYRPILTWLGLSDQSVERDYYFLLCFCILLSILLLLFIVWKRIVLADLLTLVGLYLLQESSKYGCISIVPQPWDGKGVLEDKNAFTPQSFYHSCWWPDDTRSQGISRNVIDLVCPEYSGTFSPCRDSHWSMDGIWNAIILLALLFIRIALNHSR